MIREVMPRQILLKRLSSSTMVYISRASVPCGSRMDSARSRNSIISLEDRNGRRGVKSSGFSTPAPMTSESRVRKWAREAGNRSQRINLRFSPNWSLMRWSWRTVRATDVFPTPPTPIRATGRRFPARPTIFSIKLSRPKKILGGGGGGSPSLTGTQVRRVNCQKCDVAADLVFSVRKNSSNSEVVGRLSGALSQQCFMTCHRPSSVNVDGRSGRFPLIIWNKAEL